MFNTIYSQHIKQTFIEIRSREQA